MKEGNPVQNLSWEIIGSVGQGEFIYELTTEKQKSSILGYLSNYFSEIPIFSIKR